MEIHLGTHSIFMILSELSCGACFVYMPLVDERCPRECASRLITGASLAIPSWSVGAHKGSGPQQGLDSASTVRFGEMPQWEQRQMKELFCPLMPQLKSRAIAKRRRAE